MENKNVNKIIKTSCHSRMSLSGIPSLDVQSGGDPRLQASGMTSFFTRGFTLIELLVVVLIIGILAAVAVPQYQRAVEKSKATEALTILKTLNESMQVYYLANGTYPTSFNELDVDIPFTGTTAWGISSDFRSNGDWGLVLLNHKDSIGIAMGRLTGSYQGAGFAIWNYFYSKAMPLNTPICVESASYGNPSFKKDEGEYCIKLFQGTAIDAQNSWHSFKLR